MKHKILLVDAERRSVRVLGVALRSAGYGVKVAGNGIQALERIETAIPDVIVSDSQLPKLDGYGLVENLKARRETAHVPILLLTSRGPSEDRERGRKLGVADYLPKPVFVRELVACIGLLIARSARAKIAASVTTSRTGRYSGSTKDVSVVDLLQTFELLRESGVARLLRGSEEARIYFRDGRAVNAKVGRLRGEQAVYAALLWNEAAIDVEFKPIKKEDVIDRSTGTLLVEGMRRVDAWGQIYEQMRPLTTVVEVDHVRLLEQVVSRLSDGKAQSADRDAALLQGLTVPAAVAGSGQPSFASRLDDEDDEDEDEDQEDDEDDEDEDDEDHRGHEDDGDLESDPEEPQNHRVAPAVPPTESVPTSAVQAPTFVARPTEAVARAEAVAPATQAVPSAPEPVATTAPLQAVQSHGVNGSRPGPTAASLAQEAADEGDDEPVPMIRERTVIPRELAVAAADTSSSSPSTPPWTQEVDSGADHLLDQDIPIPGVRRAISRTGRLVVTASIAVAMLICVVAGLRAMSAGRERRADEARRAEALTAIAAPAHADAIPLPPPAPVNAEPPAAAITAPAPSASEGETPHDTTTVSVGANGVASALGSSPVATDVHPNGRSPLVVAAEDALVRGAVDRALALAGQAVAAEPADADGWLALGAAHRAAGDDTAARADYRNCVAQAHTEAVNHCRVLAVH